MILARDIPLGDVVMMTPQKYLKTSLVIAFLFIFLGCASKPTGEKFDGVSPPLPADKARVIIYRDSDAFAAAYSWLVAKEVATQGAKPLAVISRNTYYTFDDSPQKISLLADLRSSPIYAPTSPSAAITAAITYVDASHTNAKIAYKALHTFEAKAGQEYYFKLQFKDVVMDPTAYLVEVPRAQAKRELEGTRLALLPSK